MDMVRATIDTSGPTGIGNAVPSIAVIIRYCMPEPHAQAEIDELITAFFAAFDNRRRAPNVADILSCFVDSAVIARSNSPNADVYTVREFALPRIDLLTRGSLVDFHESETSSTTDVFGTIAIRRSRYTKSGQLEGKHYGGNGTKCFHLALMDGDWRIVSLVWADDEV